MAMGRGGWAVDLAAMREGNDDSKKLERQKLKAMEPKRENESDGFKAEEYWLNKEGCPVETVPIRKMTKKQLQRDLDASMSLGNQYFGYNWIDFAGIRIQATPPIERFYGVSAFLSIYNPQVEGNGPYSAATIFISNGKGQNVEEIQVGWIVHPSLNGDTRTHLYTKWTVDGYQKTGCYNTKCPGFIQLSRVIPIDYAFPRTSEIESYYKEEVLLRLYQTEYFDYHLTMPVMNEEIGMWPYEVFDKLSANAGDLVQYGGKVYTPGGQYITPPMGNGKFRGGHWLLTSYMRKVLYEIEVDGIKQQVSPDESKVEPRESRCFYEGNHYNANDGYWDYNFLFGGAGGGDQSEFCQY
ncbi:hypothetical protein H5410_023553 [Solanum commersonii]|uniref:Neprosin PEP catalytic domain-containing protein n=1 Tax=Solanum commersonii TaxID=4109 RepID=A0A9J5ZJG8_SOLCO|nr:hypothetical protein H5410_023553 [Solanum commersonii]